jgi:hypothetical protein
MNPAITLRIGRGDHRQTNFPQSVHPSLGKVARPVATGCKPLLDSDWPAITRLKTPTKSLDASGGSLFRSTISPASLSEIAPAPSPTLSRWLVMLLIMLPARV